MPTDLDLLLRAPAVLGPLLHPIDLLLVVGPIVVVLLLLAVELRAGGAR